MQLRKIDLISTNVWRSPKTGAFTRADLDGD